MHLDSNLRILGANEALAAMIGRSRDDLVGQAFESLLSVSAAVLFQTHVYPALLGGGRVEEVFLTLAGGEQQPVPVLLNVERVTGPHESAAVASKAAFVALVVRIRARSQWEHELLAATRALDIERNASRTLADDLALAVRDLEARSADDQRNRVFRDAFAGVVSHELRTPITTIFGMSHVLLQHHRSMEPEALAAHLQDIEAEADRLRRLTEDLLVISRVEGGRLEVPEDPLAIGHLVRSAVADASARAFDHRFEVAIDPRLPLVLGEATYVEQVLRNFLSNAAKYSPAGTTISTTASAVEGGLEVSVTDDGIGFGDDPPDQLWELFFRSKVATKQAAGAGIGLFVARSLIEGMGGRVWARKRTQDSSSAGSEFGFWLPAAVDLGVD